VSRPTGAALDPEHDCPAGEDISAVDSRGRLSLPEWIVASVSWSPKPTRKESFDVLAVCSERGLMRLISWNTNSPQVLARRTEFIKRGDLEAVALLEHRYRRLPIPKDLRPTIGLTGTVHLGLPPSGRAAVYVVLASDQILLTSQEYRDRQMADADASGLFANLP
jgi:hypothetical protein